MVAIKAHFDGKVLVPDEPLDLQRDQRVILHVHPVGAEVANADRSVLDWIVDHVIDDSGLPADMSYQLDHYLYGTAKKP